jgi:hypothetical protein
VTSPSNANTSGLEVVGWIKRINERHPIGLTQPGDWRFTPHRPALEEGLKDEWFDVNDVVTAASAQARIAELQAENDVLKVEVIGLRAAIFGSHDYDPSLRHGNFIEMARATEDGRQGALARATAAEARADRLAKALERIEGYDWPVIVGHDVQTSVGQATGAVYENKFPIAKETALAAFNQVKAIARAALQQETQP